MYLLCLFEWVPLTNTHVDTVDRRFIFFVQQIANGPMEQVPQYSWGFVVIT